MSAPLFYTPVFQAHDVNGDPLPGARLQFYLSGTTTPTDVYADGDLTTPLSNPVIADSAGRFVPIYLDPTITYRVQLRDAALVLQYDVDPFFPLAGNFVGQITLYFGALIDLPAGWQVCDGTNGTPDMRGLFAIGVSGSHAFDSTGGSETVGGNTGAAGAHDHGGSVSAVALTADQGPVHAHDLWCWAGNQSGDIQDSFQQPGIDTVVAGEATPASRAYLAVNGAGTEIIAESGTGDPHEHDITAAVDHVHSLGTVSILPPFRALYYVMFTG